MGKALDLDLRGVFISPLARFLLTDIVCDQPRVRPHRYPRFPDIMGELDLKRRSGFLPLLERSHQSRGQVFMTATEENWPRELARDLTRWEVLSGTVQLLKD